MSLAAVSLYSGTPAAWLGGRTYAARKAQGSREPQGLRLKGAGRGGPRHPHRRPPALDSVATHLAREIVARAAGRRELGGLAILGGSGARRARHVPGPEVSWPRCARRTEQERLRLSPAHSSYPAPPTPTRPRPLPPGPAPAGTLPGSSLCPAHRRRGFRCRCAARPAGGARASPAGGPQVARVSGPGEAGTPLTCAVLRSSPGSLTVTTQPSPSSCEYNFSYRPICTLQPVGPGWLVLEL